MSAVSVARRGERGQAQIELIAGLPLVLLAGLVALQLLAVGYAQSLADGAAEAGAIALAQGRGAGAAAREALPGWAEDRVDVDADGGRVGIEVRPPGLLPGIGSHLSVTSVAWAKPAEPEP